MRKNDSVVWRSATQNSNYTFPANLNISSTIIEAIKDCLTNTTHKLAYFYLDFSDSEKHDVAILIRSLIKQLCATELEFPEVVQTLYSEYKTLGHDPSIKILTSTLLSIVDDLEKETYIVIDALDECPEDSWKSKRQVLLDQIKRMAEHRSENLHLLVTSRKKYDIETTLREYAIEICIQNSKVDADIMLHVRTCLTTDNTFKIFPRTLCLPLNSNRVKRY